MKVRADTLYLDEADHVYIPSLGPSGTCLRLNRRASELWRTWLRDGIERDALRPSERRFFERLLADGALVLDCEGLPA